MRLCRLSCACILILCLFNLTSFAEKWVLGATKFTFVSSSADVEKQSSDSEILSMLPSLILEQIVSGSARMPTDKEMLERTQEKLLTERLSLFLQLSKEIKVRDSLYLSHMSERKLKKKIASQEKKIEEINSQIDENLEKSKKADKEVEERIRAREEGENEKKDFLPFVPLKKLFLFPKDEENLVDRPKNEIISLYKDSSALLFTPSENVLLAGLDSREYAKAAWTENISGLLCASVSKYGRYISVTLELRIYPAGKVQSCITEVGSLDEPLLLARNLARRIIPEIANSMPIQLYFDISPVEAEENAKLLIDGVVTELDKKSAYIPSGVHTIEVLSDGYAIGEATYSFEGVPFFYVHVPLQKEVTGTFSLSLKEPMAGQFFVNGMAFEKSDEALPSINVGINGMSVLGQFLLDSEADNEDDDKVAGGFFYIKESLQSDGAKLTVSPDIRDKEELIDKRRKWAYRGYTALLLTLPFTFASTGIYMNNLNGFYNGYVEADEVNKWNHRRLVCTGVSLVAGGFFVFELVRYLRASSSVLPANAKKAR